RRTGPAECRANRRSTSRSANPGRVASAAPRSPAAIRDNQRPPRRVHRWSPGRRQTYLESLLVFLVLGSWRPDKTDYTRYHNYFRSHLPTGQRRGRWSGVPIENRHAVRRDELITAGVELLGGESGPALTVRAVCRQAGLTERYFYESFTDREQF